MRILKLLAGLFVTAGLALVLRLAMTANASPLMHLSAGASASATPPPAPIAQPAPEDTAGVVAPPNALHRYAVEAILSLTPPYAERNIESPEMRRARWTIFANECASAVEESGVDHQVEYTLTLIWIAHRETLIAKNPFNVGNCDEGTSLGPWSMKEWRGVDRWSPRGALKLLTTSPGAWSLPSPHPWLGIAADRGKHGVNRPSVVEYLRAHPYAADDGSSSSKAN